MPPPDDEEKSARKIFFSRNALARLLIFSVPLARSGGKSEARLWPAPLFNVNVWWENCELQLATCEDHASSSGFINCSTFDGLIASQRSLRDEKKIPMSSRCANNVKSESHRLTSFTLNHHHRHPLLAKFNSCHFNCQLSCVSHYERPIIVSASLFHSSVAV